MRVYNMKKNLRKRRLIRWADGLLPLSLLLASALGMPRESLTLAVCTLAARLLALSTAGSVRAAFAYQPAMRDVRGSVKAALCLQPVGFLLSIALLAVFNRDWQNLHLLPFILAGLFLNLEQVFYEYLYSAGDGRIPFITRLITAALCCEGLSLAELNNASVSVICGLSCLASCVVALVIGNGLKVRINASPLRSSPRFMLQDALYPAAFAGLALWNPLGLFADQTTIAVAGFAGLTLYCLCCTTFRRSKLEAGPMNAVLGIVVAASALLGCTAYLLRGKANVAPAGALFDILSVIPAIAIALALGALCGFALFGNAGREKD